MHEMSYLPRSLGTYPSNQLQCTPNVYPKVYKNNQNNKLSQLSPELLVAYNAGCGRGREEPPFAQPL